MKCHLKVSYVDIIDISPEVFVTNQSIYLSFPIKKSYISHRSERRTFNRESQAICRKASGYSTTEPTTGRNNLPVRRDWDSSFELFILHYVDMSTGFQKQRI